MRFSSATFAALVLASTALAAPMVIETETVTLTVTKDVFVPYPTSEPSPPPTTSTVPTSTPPPPAAGKLSKNKSTSRKTSTTSTPPLPPPPPPPQTPEPAPTSTSTPPPPPPPPTSTPAPPPPAPSPTSTSSLAPAPSPTSTSSLAPAPSPTGGLDEFAQGILDKHNGYRAIHHAPPLTYNHVMAAFALQTVQDCIMHHSGGSYGENLAMGTYITAGEAIDLWYKEQKLYNYANPGFYSKTGHFTQVVWLSAKEVGCAIKDCSSNGVSNFYVSCNYDHGNLIGAFKENVLAP